jgi:regulatory protein
MAGRSSARRSASGRSSTRRSEAIGRPDSAGRPEAEEIGESADPESVARLICLRLLTAAPRTRAQLADALRRRGVPADAAESVLSRFAEVGLVDDTTFAAAWVESRHFGRGLGRRALVAELGRRGVERDDIEAAVQQLSAETERATALALVERRLASTTGSTEAARIKKLVAMLARKGYSGGLAYAVVREAIERAGQDAAELGDEDAFGYEFSGDDEFSGDGQFEEAD